MNRFTKVVLILSLVLFAVSSVVLAQNDPLKQKYDFALDDFNNAKNTSDPAKKDEYFDAALQKFQEIVDEDANYTPAWYHIGLIYYERNQFDKALKPLQQVAQFDTTIATRAACNFYIGMSHYKQEEYADALEPFETAYQLEADKAYYTYQLADTYMKLNMNNMAIPLYEKVAKMNDDNLRIASLSVLRTHYWETNQLDKALGACEEIAKVNPQDKNNNIMLAQIYQKKGDWDSAISAWLNVNQLDPEDCEVLNRLGNLLVTKKNNYTRAIEYLEKTEPKECANALTYYTWGSALQELGNIDGALDKYQKTIELDPVHQYAYLKIAKIHFDSGDYTASLSTINKVLDIQQNGFAYMLRGQIYDKLHKFEEDPIVQIKKLKCAIEDFERAKRVDSRYRANSDQFIDYCNKQIKHIYDTNILVEDISAFKCER